MKATTVEELFAYFDVRADSLHLPANLQPLDDRAPLWGTPAARAQPYLVQGQIDPFLAQAPPDYCLVGFWGHGINSYGIYLVRTTPASRIYLRLYYGGVYGDEPRDRRRVGSFLRAFAPLAAAAGSLLQSLVAVESMGLARYELVTRHGIVIKSDCSHFRERTSEFAQWLEAARERDTN